MDVLALDSVGFGGLWVEVSEILAGVFVVYVGWVCCCGLFDRRACRCNYIMMVGRVHPEV